MASRGKNETMTGEVDKQRKTVKDDGIAAQNKGAARKASAATGTVTGHKDGVSRVTAVGNKARGASHASDTHDGIQKPQATVKKTEGNTRKPKTAASVQKAQSSSESAPTPQQTGPNEASRKAIGDNQMPLMFPRLGKAGWVTAAVAAGAVGAIVVGAVRLHATHNTMPTTLENPSLMGPGDE